MYVCVCVMCVMCVWCGSIDTEPWLIFSGRYYVRELSIDGQYYNLLKEGLSNVVALDIHMGQQRLYFADVGSKKIQTIFINGTDLQTVAWQSLPGVEGLAVDWIAKYGMYMFMYMLYMFMYVYIYIY